MSILNLLSYNKRQWHIALALSSICLIIISIISVVTGEIWISPFTSMTPLEEKILMDLRLPRMITAILIGASLSVAGCILQILLGNPLAEPGVLGISGGASLFLVITLFFFPTLESQYVLMFASMIGALIFTGILVGCAMKGEMSTSRLLLIGVALSILSGAIVTWAFYFSSDQNLRQLMNWLMGSLSGVNWEHLTLSAIIIPTLIWACHQGKKLDLLMLGDVHAIQMGVDVHAARWKLILAVSLLVGVSVAMAGVIGFVGLVVPHFLRLLLGTENRYLLPLSAFTGASLMVGADILGRISIPHAELPVGAITSTIGAPLFIWILLKRT